MKGSVQFGAKQAVHNCVGVKPGENVLIVTDLATRMIAGALRTEAESIEGVVVDYFVMEDFGKRPDNGSNPLEFPYELTEFFEAAHVSFYAATSKKGELKSFRRSLLSLINENKNLRHAHMPGVTEQIMSMGMSADYNQVQKITDRLSQLLENVDVIEIDTAAGTSIRAQFSEDLKWVKCNGIITPEKWSNLPDGEIYTIPLSISGKIIIDGVLGDYFGDKYGLLHDTPVTYIIRDGVVDDIQCENPYLVSDLEDYMAADDNADRVGEFAIGTNIGIDKLIGNMLQDEKIVGFHLATGNPCPEKTGVDWSSDTHLDAVVKNPSITVFKRNEYNGRTIMKDGKFSNAVLE